MKQLPEIIYLIPGEYEGERGLVWCDDPAPDDHCDPDEAVKYVRADAFEQAQAEIKQLKRANFIKGDLAIEWKVKLDKAQARVAEYEALTDELDATTRRCYLSGPTVVNQFKRLRQQADDIEMGGE